MSFTGEFPVLIGQDDLDVSTDRDIRYRKEFWIDGIKPILESKLAEGRDAIADAVGLLLTTSAVVLVHIDIHNIRKSYVPDDERLFYVTPYSAIGFNDNFGGSESRFKILLNGSPNGVTASHVLYSPPYNDGSPSNTTFRQCDFVFLNRTSTETYDGPGYVPNPLKTAGAAGYRGFSDYKYFLFGDSDLPKKVYERFADAGFEFSADPYDTSYRETSEYRKMRLAESEAMATLGYRGGHFWPGDQFAENLKRIGLEMPKLSAEDYPLVRAENMLLS